MIGEPEADDDGSNQHRVENDRDIYGASFTYPIEEIIVYGFLLNLQVPGSDKPVPVEDAAKHRERTTCDQCDVEHGQFAHKDCQNDSGNEDPQHQRYFHVKVHQIVRTNRDGVLFVFL